ncbi:uncharacterized protein LOC129779648 isoform X3 [Toxorhynchites rutilus septentrionalis]|uniref:uncharacterized protein LOC129779648 isoform X3 n=1 Tax=Toxorhynchites rutilus septentrionalis TaxID=329112 RepID=UPI00247903F6|nr:uncharacterized protein LOC129779648 isoform X3 [Toxorhynchites rutilus septentrionalis]
MVPKKIFRYVVKGAHFYRSRNGQGFTMDELVTYVYLKNNKMDSLDMIIDAPPMEEAEASSSVRNWESVPLQSTSSTMAGTSNSSPGLPEDQSSSSDEEEPENSKPNHSEPDANSNQGHSTIQTVNPKTEPDVDTSKENRGPV